MLPHIGSARYNADMASRTIAIGDIHGCSVALAALLQALDPQADDTVVTLGDYLDRGIDSKGVLDLLIQLEKRCRLIPLLGNHEEMMLGATEGKDGLQFWRNCGGDTTLDSYGFSGRLSLIPREHFAFVERCRLFHQTETHIFVHANYRGRPADGQAGSAHTALAFVVQHLPGPHFSGKIAIVGHTPQQSGDIMDLGYLTCIDTGCCSGGWLTALAVDSGQVWQVDERGKVR